MTRFTLAHLERAHAEWSCSCGPASLAAICDLTLDEVRPHFPGFRGWTNPTMMFAALRSAGKHPDVTVYARGHCDPARATWPSYGLARIQWEGPWLKPGVPIAARYRHTHWVGVKTLSEQVSLSGDRDLAIWDINACQAPCEGWLDEETWRTSLVPFLTADIKRASGGWHITHAIEVSR